MSESIPSVIRTDSVWCWEPLKPGAREEIRVVGTELRGEDGWVQTETQRNGELHWNEVSRFIEAAVLVRPGP